MRHVPYTIAPLLLQKHNRKERKEKERRENMLPYLYVTTYLFTFEFPNPLARLVITIGKVARDFTSIGILLFIIYLVITSSP